LFSVSQVIDNIILREEIVNVQEMVVNGTSLRVSLQQCKFFPEMAVNMMSVGEETGQTEAAFNKIADTYEKQSDGMVQTALALLGPCVLVVIVGFVGFVVIAMLLPIFKMNMAVQ